MSKSIKAMQSAMQNVHILAPTLPHATRLMQFYNRAYLDDEALLARVCRSEAGIDGLTEAQSKQRLLGAMSMRDTVTLEYRSPNSSECDGFIIVRWATPGSDSLADFRSYFLGDVFMEEQLQFRSSEETGQFHALLEQGNVAYITEIVSSGESGVTLALISAAYLHVKRMLGTEDFAILGKCLHATKIGRCSNELGNQPIQTFVTAVGLRPIGRCAQRRPLAFADHSPLLDRAFPDGLPLEVFAELEFGLYLGSSQGVAKIAAQCDSRVLPNAE